MTPDTLAPSPLLDRARVAEAIKRGVRLDLHPAIAKAAVHGTPVELTEEQSLAVADVALEALVKAHPIAGREWLVKANRDWRWRAGDAEVRRRALVAAARRELGAWRRVAITAWYYFGNLTAQVEWHWPRWSSVAAVPLLVGVIWFVERRAARRDGAR